MSARRSHTRAPFHALGMALAAAAGMHVAPARADVVSCPANTGEIESMMAAAAQGGQNYEIRIRSGVFLRPNQGFRIAANPGFNVTVSGGWNSSCQIQTLNPALTVLDGNDDYVVLFVNHVGGFNSPGTLQISNLSLTGGQTENGFGGCMQVNASEGSPTYLFDRIIVRGCRNDGVLGLGGAIRIQNFTSARITLRNSLVADNFAGSGAGLAMASNHPNAVTSLINNTIVNNTSSNSTGAGGVQRIATDTAAGKFFIYNNIIFGNRRGNGVPLDLQLDVGSTSDQLFYNNAVQAFTNNNLTQSGTLITANPGFRPGGFQLRGDSPLLNAGMALSPILSGTRDLAFSPRVLQDEIDIGAYEYADIFQSGFE